MARNRARLDKANFDLIEAIEAYAAERGLSMLQVAIGGLAAMPTFGSVIAGATSEEQVKQNVSAGLWVPSGDDLEAVLEITKSAV